jgi:hypothetical protein
MRSRLSTTALLLIAAAATAACSRSPEAGQQQGGEQKPAAAPGGVHPLELQGTWVFDLKASLDKAQGTARTALEAKRGMTYTFTGDLAEMLGTKAGYLKGKFRTEGKEIVISSRRGEERFQLALKGNELVLSSNGVRAVFRRK